MNLRPAKTVLKPCSTYSATSVLEYGVLEYQTGSELYSKRFSEYGYAHKSVSLCESAARPKTVQTCASCCFAKTVPKSCQQPNTGLSVLCFLCAVLSRVLHLVGHVTHRRTTLVVYVCSGGSITTQPRTHRIPLPTGRVASSGPHSSHTSCEWYRRVGRLHPQKNVASVLDLYTKGNGESARCEPKCDSVHINVNCRRCIHVTVTQCVSSAPISGRAVSH